MIHVAMSYSHQDESMRDALESHLKVFEREGLLQVWHDRQLVAGDDVDSSILREFDKAHIVLLLVSSDFMSSDYCWSKELQRALERRDKGELRVIPVILRKCNWQAGPLGALVALPCDGKPITGWTDRDAAYSDVAAGVAEAARNILREAREDVLRRLASTYEHNDDLSWYYRAQAIDARKEHVHQAFGSAGAGNVAKLIGIAKDQLPINREDSYRALVEIREHFLPQPART